MGTRDPRVDAYIADASAFAKPILASLRETVHAVCPDVEETMKWSFPHFDYGGMLCSMAAFKQHCAFGFWKAKLIIADGDRRDEDAMGQFGRITSLSDLPTKKALTGYIKRAMQLNDEGVKAPRPKCKAKPPPVAPDYLIAALKKNAKARKTYEAFSPSNQREYIEWLVDAKGEDTRARRLASAVEWMAEGKSRNWKYEKC